MRHRGQFTRRAFATLSGRPLPAETSNDEPPKPKKLKDLLKDNEDLQAELDDMIERRLERDRRGRKKKPGDDDDGDGDGLTKKEREELETLRAGQRDAEQRDLEAKKQYDKALEVERDKWTQKETSLKKQAETLATELRAERVRGRIIAAASAAGAVDPNDVAVMLEGRVDLDDKFQPFVKHEKDATRRATNNEGEDLTIEELVTGLLEKKPHLAKAAEGDGSGAKGGASTGHESAVRGTQTGKQKSDIATLEKAFNDAKAQAEKTATPAHVTRMQQAAKRLDEAKKALATK